MAVKTFYASKDATMAHVPGPTTGGWNGKDNHLAVGFTGTYAARSLVYFPIDFTGMWSITSAKIFLVTSTNSSAHAIQTAAPTSMITRCMIDDWGEGSVNPGEGQFDASMPWKWGNRATSFTGFNSVTTNIDQDASGTEEEVDITEMVRYWHLGNPNYGVQLYNNTAENSDSTHALLFFSREAGAELRPRIEITYTTNTQPGAPTKNSPLAGAVVNSLTPQFSVTRNDVDAGDYISAVQIQVYKGGYRYLWSTSTSSGPSVGTIRLDNATYASATKFYINETTNTGENISAVMDFAALTMIINESGSKYIRFNKTNMVDNGTHRTYDTTPLGMWERVGSNFTDGEIVYFVPEDGSVTQSHGVPIWDYTGSPPAPITSSTVPYGSTAGVINERVFPALPLFGNRDYLWRARTRDQGLSWSPFTPATQFRVNTTPNSPTLSVSPLPLTAVPTNTPVYTITHNDNDVNDNKMHGYQVIVEAETSVGSGDWAVVWDTGQVDTSGSAATTKAITSAALTYAKSHRVKARTKDSNSTWSAFSTTIAFTTYGTEQPINLTPSTGGSTSTTPSFSGERGSASHTITSYQIQVYTDDLQTLKWDSGTLTSGISSGTTFAAVYAGSALTAGLFYQWRVRVTSSLGTSSYTSFQRFEIADPSVPTLSVPITTGISTLTPTFTGSRSASFDRFQIQLYPVTASTSNPGTPLYDSGTLSATIGAGGLGTQFTKVYPGSPALAWGTTYKWRARVSADGGTNWTAYSGMSSFTTLAAAVPVLTSVGGTSYPTHPWITDTTPDFVITRGASDTIDKAQVRIWNSTGTTLLWDSGMLDVTNATTATITSGVTLNPGRYLWDARYTAATAAIGGYATRASFTVNSPPDIPTNMSPEPASIVVDTDRPLFAATFSDADVSTLLDLPTEWEIVVEEADGDPVGTVTVSSDLFVGQNEYRWATTDTTLTVNTDYRWKTRFRDSKSVYGAYSAYNTFTLRTSPNGTITIPSDESTVNISNPLVKWDYVSAVAQLKFNIDVDMTNATGSKLSDVFNQTVVSSVTQFTIPPGYLKDNTYYNITLTVYDDDNVPDPSPSTVNVRVEQNPPDPVQGLSPTSTSAGIYLDWDTATMKTTPVVHKFVAYRVYRRLRGDIEWQSVGEVRSLANSEYLDLYAGNNVQYQYRVTVVATVVGQESVQIESADDPNGGSFCESTLQVDNWSIVGADRSEEHIMELPVTEESHNRVVQQETFETLGSNRKVILRGFVLGHEGSITCVWTDMLVALPNDPQRFYQESVIGRRLLDYITHNKGPHILKSPFGDVWDVEFAGPQYQWSGGGNLEVTLEWIETGQTSQVSI